MSAEHGEGTPLAPTGSKASVKRKLWEHCPFFLEFDETWSAEKAHGTLEPWGFSVGLAAEIFPRGVLPLTAGFTTVGLPYTLLLGGVVYSGAIFSMWAIGRVSEATGEVTWRGQWARLLGSRTAFVPVVCVVVTTFMCCSCTLAAAAALASDVGVVPYGKPGVLVVMVGALLRLVTTRRCYTELETVATVAVCSAAVSALVVLWRAVDGSYSEGGPFENHLYDGSARFKTGPLDFMPRAEMVVLLSLLCNALLVHHNGCRLYRELQRVSPAEHWTWTSYTFSAVFVAYFVVMAAGVWTFGAQAQAVVLDNYASQDFLGGVARLASAVALACSVPLTFAALREAASDLVSDWSSTGKEALKFVAGQNVLAVALLLLIAAVAWAMDSPYQVVGLSGCFLGACCSFLLPCALLWAVQRGEPAADDGEPTRESRMTASVFCLGCVILVAGAVAPIAERSYYFVDYEPLKVYRQAMSNVDDMQYYGEVTVGGQKMSAVLDTGSSELVVLSDKCKDNCGKQSLKFYHADSSPTYGRGDLQLKLRYGSGEVFCAEAYDKVRIGPIVANQAAFWEGYDVGHEMEKLLEKSQFQVVAGLGPISPDTRPFRPGSALNVQAYAALLPALGVRRFSICLGQLPGSDGYMTWNDDAKIKNPGLFLKVHVPPTGYWMAQLTDVRLGGKLVACGWRGCGGIVDSGTSLLAMPKEHLAVLKQSILDLDPNCQQLSSMPSLTFKLGGVPLSLSADAYLGDFSSDAVDNYNGTDKTGSSCQPSLVEVALSTYMGPTWIIGLPFFRQYYTVFVQSAKLTPAAMYVAPASKHCGPAAPDKDEEGSGRAADEQAQGALPRRRARKLRWDLMRLPRWARRQKGSLGVLPKASSALRGAGPAATGAAGATPAAAAAQ